MESLQVRSACPTAAEVADACLPGQVWRNVRAGEANSSVAEPGCLQASFFVAHADRWEIGLEHHVQSSVDPMGAWGVRDLHGTLIDQAGNTVVALGGHKRDAFSLEDLLRSAGVRSLDEPSDSDRYLEPCADWQRNNPDACCEDFGLSMRARGLYLELEVSYTNLAGSWLLPQRQPLYTVRARRVPRAEAYATEATEDVSGAEASLKAAAAAGRGRHRVVRLAAGVHISARQTGEVGHASLRCLAMWLVGLSAALTTAWNACELAIELMPATRLELYKEHAA